MNHSACHSLSSPGSGLSSGAVQRSRGFTLLELTIALSIIALVTAMGMSAVPGIMESVRRAETENTLNRIEQALDDYRSIYGRLPCPSDITLAESDADFGLEAANKGSCTGGTPAATYGPVKKVVEGGVPYKLLGLPKEAAYDGWGRRIAYAVWATMTEERAFTTYSMKDENCGGVTIRNDSTLPITEKALYVVFSHGADGHGGYDANGNRVNASNADAMTLENCNCDSNGAADTWDAEYAGMLHTATFDDHLRYKYRWQLQDEEQSAISLWPGVCTQAFYLDGLNAYERNGHLGASNADMNGDGKQDFILASYEAISAARGSVHILLSRSRNSWPFPGQVLSTGAGTLIDGITGFRFDGGLGNGQRMRTAVAGDLNADGIDDLVLVTNSQGFVVLWGNESGWAATQTVNDTWLSGGGIAVNGARFTNDPSIGCGYGYSIALGDVNGDDHLDIVAYNPSCAPGSITSAGSTYVIYGGDVSAWQTSQVLDSTFLDGGGTALNGFRLDGDASPSSWSGGGLASADINGDGYDDIVIGYATKNVTGSNRGTVEVIYGGPRRKDGTPWQTSQTINTTFLNGPGTAMNGFRLAGRTGSTFLGSVIRIGNLNGDRFADMVFTGAWNPTQIVWGKATGWSTTQVVNDTWLAGSGTIDNGFSLTDGISSVAISDFDLDGYDDFLFGLPGFDPGGRTDAGSASVIYGGPNRKDGTAWATTQTVDDTFLNGSGTAVNGFRINGVVAGDELGDYVATGDIDNDGMTDFIIGSIHADPDSKTNAGVTYVVYGRSHGWLTHNELTDMLE